MIVSGRGVSIAAASREGRRRCSEAEMTAVITDWATKYPHLVVALKRQTQFLRETSWDGKGGGRNKMTALQGQIPVTLNTMMVRKYGRMWLQDWKLKRMFWSLFKIGVVAKNSLMEDRW